MLHDQHADPDPTVKPDLATIDPRSLVWLRSSYSNGSGGMCVEVARPQGGGALLRDSKNPDDATLAFSADEWDAFRAGVKAGEFGI